MIMTPEQLQKNIELANLAATELRWKQIESRVKVEDEMTQKLIGTGEKLCPVCRGVGMVKLLFKGLDTGVEYKREANCVCLYYREFWGKLLTTTPVHDQWARLNTLTPNAKCRLPLERQAKIIKFLQENPDLSYVFSGPSGTGKSTWAAALYHRALHRAAVRRVMGDPVPESVWRVTAKNLCSEHTDYVLRRETLNPNGDWDPPKEPTVSEKKINAAALGKFKDQSLPRLFLEEIDKISLTDYKVSVLWEVVNAIYSNDGQCVVNTNLTIENLTTFLQQGSESKGPMFARRLYADGKGKVINLYDEK
jgi:hypothetical protein